MSTQQNWMDEQQATGSQSQSQSQQQRHEAKAHSQQARSDEFSSDRPEQESKAFNVSRPQHRKKPDHESGEGMTPEARPENEGLRSSEDH